MKITKDIYTSCAYCFRMVKEFYIGTTRFYFGMERLKDRPLPKGMEIVELPEKDPILPPGMEIVHLKKKGSIDNIVEKEMPGVVQPSGTYVPNQSNPDYQG